MILDKCFKHLKVEKELQQVIDWVTFDFLILHLDDEWEDCLSSFRIVLELLLVVAVLAQRPHGHLIGPGQAEQTGFKGETKNFYEILIFVSDNFNNSFTFPYNS